MRMIKIEVIGKGKALAKLDDRNPKIRESFFRALPMEGIANLWGDEVYFDVPLQVENENPSLSATAGDICYWSQGPAFCIFFGKHREGHREAGDIQERSCWGSDSVEQKVSCGILRSGGSRPGGRGWMRFPICGMRCGCSAGSRWRRSGRSPSRSGCWGGMDWTSTIPSQATSCGRCLEDIHCTPAPVLFKRQEDRADDGYRARSG